MRRFMEWSTRHTLLIAVVLDFIIIASFAWALQNYNDANVARAKDQVIHEAKERADQIAASQRDVCERAVTAVSNRLNADLLKITGSFESEGRPKPAWAVQLEILISNEEPPLAACIPKENP